MDRRRQKNLLCAHMLHSFMVRIWTIKAMSDKTVSVNGHRPLTAIPVTHG